MATPATRTSPSLAAERFERVPAGSFHWRRWPGPNGIGAIAVPKTDAPALLERGWVRIDGLRATVTLEGDEVWNVELRLCFDEGYPFPHP
jgi:hypothetical protein